MFDRRSHDPTSPATTSSASSRWACGSLS